MKESDIQNSILELLRYQGIYAWRQGNHSVFDKSMKVYRTKSKYEINGVSDILGVLSDGKFLAIEVKKNEIQRRNAPKAQLDFISRVNELGGVGFFAINLDDVDKELESYYERPIPKNPN